MQLNIPLSADILNAVAKLDHFRGVWAAGSRVPPDRLSRLRDAARIRSVASSCRMSGVRVSDLEAAALLRGDECQVREGAQVLGYAEALDRVFPSSGPLVTTDEVCRLHAVMIGAPGNPPEPSRWREEPLHLEAFDAEGKAMGRVFQTLPPRLVPEKLDTLATWLELETRSGEHHPLLVIGGFMLAFLAASPFAHGNGRMGRLLAVHLLRRAGYSYLPYASLERVMEEMRQAYYDAFDSSETRLWSGEADLAPWTGFFLSALSAHAEQVQAKLDLEQRALDLSPLQRRILELVRDHGSVGAGFLIASIGTNRNTLKDNLRRLVERGLLERSGKLRGTLYRLATGEPAAERAPVAARAQKVEAPVADV